MTPLKSLLLSLSVIAGVGVVIAVIVLVIILMKKATSSSVILTGEVVPAYYTTLGITKLWDEGYKGEGINVLVIDTGTNLRHIDVSDIIQANVNNDEEGHGTHVAGIVTGNINGVGMVGVAPNATVYSWDMGAGFLSSILSAFNWAMLNNIDVINMSFGSDEDSQEFHDKIAEARGRGIFMVAAAGNESSPNVIFPARWEEVISVASLKSNGRLSSFSNYDASVIDCAMYGENILSDNADFTGNSDLLVSMSGTSMATPFVTGLTALMLQRSKALGEARPTMTRMIALLNQHLPQIVA